MKSLGIGKNPILHFLNTALCKLGRSNVIIAVGSNGDGIEHFFLHDVQNQIVYKLTKCCVTKMLSF